MNNKAKKKKSKHILDNMEKLFDSICHIKIWVQELKKNLSRFNDKYTNLSSGWIWIVLIWTYTRLLLDCTTL